MMKKYQRFLWYPVVLLLALVFALVQHWRYPEVVAHLTQQACDPTQHTCVFEFHDLSLTIGLSPQQLPIRSLDSVPILVKSQGTAVSAVQVDLVGLNENMGLLRTNLKVNSNSFSGNVFIPTCIQQNMQWQMTVMAHTEAGIYAAELYFTSEK